MLRLSNLPGGTEASSEVTIQSRAVRQIRNRFAAAMLAVGLSAAVPACCDMECVESEDGHKVKCETRQSIGIGDPPDQKND